MTDEELLDFLGSKTTAYAEQAESLIAYIKRQLGEHPEDSFLPSHLNKLERIFYSLQKLKIHPQIYQGKMEFNTDINVRQIIINYVRTANYACNHRSKNHRKQKKAGRYVKNAVQIQFSTKYDVEEYSDVNIFIYEQCLPVFKIVIEQLVDNAIKYTPNSLRETDPIEVCFEYSRQFRYKAFSITNWGPLVEVDEKEELFEAEKRGRYAAAIQNVGLGIGLYLVKRIADLHSAQTEIRIDDSAIRLIDGVPHAKFTFTLMMVYDAEGNVERTSYRLESERLLFPKICIHEINRDLLQIFTWSKSVYEEFYHQQKELYSAFIRSEFVPLINQIFHTTLDLYALIFLTSWLIYRNKKVLLLNEDYKNFRLMEDGFKKYAFGLRPDLTTNIDMQAPSQVASWQPIVNEIFCYRLLRYTADHRTDPSDTLQILYDGESVILEADSGFDFGASPFHEEIKNLQVLDAADLMEYEPDFLAEIAKLHSCMLLITNKIILWK